MPILNSPNWNQQIGVCMKHYTPQLPCSQCLAENPDELEILITETDLAVLDYNPTLAIEDLIPQWLARQIN